MYGNIKNPYIILGINNTSNKDEIKKAYKEIALSCHPDKLIHITDEIEKQKRIDKFKEASIAYEILTNTNKYHGMSNGMGETHDGTYEDTEGVWENTWNDDAFEWKDVWSKFFNKEAIKDTIFDIANQFVKSKIYPKSYYNPSSNIEPKKIHEIKLEVSYNEIITNAKKKLRLILVDINDPIFIDIYCGYFPQIIKEYTDDSDDCNEVIHEIIINMEIKKQDNFEHIISKNGSIDIITTLDIALQEYILGTTKKIEYIDGKTLEVNIPSFQKEYYEIYGKGIKKGSFIINLCVKNIENSKWDALNEKDKAEMIRILETCS
jgi:DnaJ-class molecular chaperone